MNRSIFGLSIFNSAAPGTDAQYDGAAEQAGNARRKETLGLIHQCAAMAIFPLCIDRTASGGGSDPG